MSNERNTCHLIGKLSRFMSRPIIRFFPMIRKIYKSLEIRIVLDKVIQPAHHIVRIKYSIIIFAGFANLTIKRVFK